MTPKEFQSRTKGIALRVIRLVESLPQGRATAMIGGQLLRSGTSIGANYRAACRGQSPKDVIAKLKIVEEESDESLFWLELLIEANLMRSKRLDPLMSEINEILAMTVASIKTIRNQGRSTARA